MSNKLMPICSELFSIGDKIPLLDEEMETYQAFRKKVESAFTVMASELRVQGKSDSIIQDVTFALSAYLDERVLSSRWPGKLTWQENSLQRSFFDEPAAGERFFSRLAELSAEAELNIEILEIFYVCLAFGFEGIYKVRGLSQLANVTQALISEISRARPPEKALFLASTSPERSKQSIITKISSTKRLAVVVVALISMTYLGYRLVFEWQSRRALAVTEAMMEVVEDEFRQPVDTDAYLW